MASFKIAKQTTARKEGGYVPLQVAVKIKDAGGETYLGVSRTFNLDTVEGKEFWGIVDNLKKINGTPKLGGYFRGVLNDRLLVLKDLIFKKKYWDTLNLDAEKNQSIANFAFDFSVNHGFKNVLKILNKVQTLSDKERFNALKTERLRLINLKKDSFDKSLIDRTNSFLFENNGIAIIFLILFCAFVVVS